MLHPSVIICHNSQSSCFVLYLYGCETWYLKSRKEYRLRVFENRVLRRISEPKLDEMTWSWRKLPNEELHNLYSSSNVIRKIKLIIMRLAGHVARESEIKMCAKFLLESLKGWGHSEDLGVDGTKLLQYREIGFGVWIGFIWLRIGPVACYYVTGINRLNSHFLRPSPTRSRDVSSDGQTALVIKLGVSPSRSRLSGPHRYHPGTEQEAQGRSSETAVSPHHNNQSTIYNVPTRSSRTFTETAIIAQLVGK
jgi:hypothetical protein